MPYHTDHSPIYHAPIIEDAAEKILKEHFADGNFLIRESKATDNAYTLSLCYDKQILCYRIFCDSDGTYSFKYEEYQGEQHCRIVHTKFPTFCDLINSHKQNTVSIDHG